jgi:hypothetical protein
MTRRVKIHIVGAAAVAAFGLAATAVDNYSETGHLAVFSLFPYLLGVMLGGTAHNPNLAGYVLGLVLEWALIGSILSGLVYLFTTPGAAQREPDRKQH